MFLIKSHIFVPLATSNLHYTSRNRKLLHRWLINRHEVSGFDTFHFDSAYITLYHQQLAKLS